MKLIRIKATNFKGASFDEPLHALTIFVGSNFAGKTARTDAIRLLLLGYLPELGKAARATFGLCSGTEMTVEGEFDNGQLMRRRFYVKGDTVKQDADIPACFGGVGGPIMDLSVMMDASTYFGLSDRARVEYVFGLVKLGEEWTPAALRGRLAKLEMPDQLMKKINYDSAEATSGQEFVEMAIETTTAYWKDAKAHGIKMEQTIQGLSALRAADLLTGPTLAQLEEQRGTIQRKLTDLSEKKGRQLGSFTQMKADRARREVIDRELRFGDKNRFDLQSAKDKLALVENEIAAHPPAADRAALGDELARTTNAIAMLIMQQEAVASVNARLIRDLEGLEAAKACPYCGACGGDEWKVKKALEINGELTKVGQRIEELGIMRASADAANRLALAALKEFDVDAAQRVALFNTLIDVKAEISRLEPMIARLEVLAAEKARLLTDDPDLTAAVEMLQVEINLLEQDAREADAGIKEAQARAGEIQRLATAEKERDQAKSDQAQAEDVGKQLRAIQGEMVEAAFTPLLQIANGFYQGVLKAPLAYHQGEIGMWRDSRWVAHHTFSGTEKALTYAAIQSALAQKSPCRIMLIDELGRLDDGNVKIMLRATLNAIEGQMIDSFVGIDAGRLQLYHAAESDASDSAFLVTQVG